MNRRKFLALAGGGVIVAAGVRVGMIATRTPDEALKPWSEAGSLYTEPRKKALSYAILAPNPHNRQPWLVDLSRPDKVVLTADLNRLLPHTDPFSRQITIGLGCFLEVLRMAAAADGYRVDLDLFPDGGDTRKLDARPIAVATFQKDSTQRHDPLFDHIMQRRSVKEPYDLSRPVRDEALAGVRKAANHTRAFATSDPARVEALRRLTTNALIIEVDTPRTFKESVDLFRIGKAEVEANPDGIDFSGPMFELLHATGQFTREAAMDTESSAFAQGKASVLENTRTAMAHVWQITQGNTRVDQIRAGQDWVRINLAATAAGLATQPLSQALQEYPEMKSLYKQVHDKLAPEGGTVQMLARLGYAEAVPASPRWPLKAKLVEG